MASGIELKVNQSDLQRVLDLMSPRQAQKAHVLVLNKLVTRARKISKDSFVKRFNVKPAGVKVYVRRASASNPRAYVYGRMTPYSLMRFRPEQIGSGVQIEIVRGQSIMLPGAFIEQPEGRNWRSRGQLKTRTSNVPVVLQRATEAPYKLLGDTALLRPEQRASLGKFIISGENRTDIQRMINKEAPALLQQTIDDQVHRRAKKIGIDVEGAE